MYITTIGMNTRTFFCIALIAIHLKFNAQIFTEFKKNGGQYTTNTTPCLLDSERALIKETLLKQTKLLRAKNKLINKSTASVTFTWPVQKADHVTYNDVWSISNYVDHDSDYPDKIEDYNCGAKSYDTDNGYNHAGTDIFSWPFSWQLMDTDGVEIIAAAAGQIIWKNDGEFDRNCSFNSNNWNAIYIKHNDGSVAWYGHFKEGSLTSKSVGDMVSQGDYLGVMGSSGNSTGPHLHFEVYASDNYSQLIDPFSGNCNNLNTTSWWANQKPYLNPNINAILTHSAPPEFPDCPTTETPNISNSFELTDDIYLAIYLRDQMANSTIKLRILKPDNTVLENWENTLEKDYSASWWYWTLTNNYLDMEGEWTWEATYQNQTLSHKFTVGTLAANDFSKNSTLVFPNPITTDHISLKTNIVIDYAKIYDIHGKLILEPKLENTSNTTYTIDTSSLLKGMYFLVLKTNQGQEQTFKLINQ